MKLCKQCGKGKADELFRSYYPRGTGKYRTKVGRNTICLECEQLNSTVSRIWKADKRTDKEERLLVESATYYRGLIARGLEPIGVYVEHIRGEDGAEKKKSLVDALLDGLAEGSKVNKEYMAEYQKLIDMELVDEPDVYQEMIYELMSKTCLPNGKIKPEYQAIFNKATERIDDYEDNYEW